MATNIIIGGEEFSISNIAYGSFEGNGSNFITIPEAVGYSWIICVLTGNLVSDGRVTSVRYSHTGGRLITAYFDGLFWSDTGIWSSSNGQLGSNIPQFIFASDVPYYWVAYND